MFFDEKLTLGHPKGRFIPNASAHSAGPCFLENGLLVCGVVVCGLIVLGFVGLVVWDFSKKLWRLVAWSLVKKEGVQIIENNIKHLSKIVQIPSKINQKRSQIDENASLEGFRRQIAPRSAPGTLPDESVKIYESLFGRQLHSKGPCWGPADPKIR